MRRLSRFIHIHDLHLQFTSSFLSSPVTLSFPSSLVLAMLITWSALTVTQAAATRRHRHHGSGDAITNDLVLTVTAQPAVVQQEALNALSLSAHIGQGEESDIVDDRGKVISLTQKLSTSLASQAADTAQGQHTSQGHEVEAGPEDDDFEDDSEYYGDSGDRYRIDNSSDDEEEGEEDEKVDNGAMKSLNHEPHEEESDMFVEDSRPPIQADNHGVISWTNRKVNRTTSLKPLPEPPTEGSSPIPARTSSPGSNGLLLDDGNIDGKEVKDELMEIRRLPQAIIIGVKKGGTRALLEFLRIHPDVKAPGPEIHFFDRNYDKGLDWYRDQMPPTTAKQITVEKTPSYFVTKSAPERVHAMSPDVRLIVVVRDPVTRAISDYAQAQAKRPDMPSFARMAFIDNSTAERGGGPVATSWGAIKISVYAKHVERWLQYFPLTQFHFVHGERLISDPAGELALLQDFLGLKRVITEQHFYFDTAKGFPCLKRSRAAAPDASAVSVAQESSSEFLAVARGNKDAQSSRLLFGEKIRNNSSSPPPLHCLGKTKGRTHPAVDETVMRRLRDFFRPFNEKFYRLTRINFGWP